MYWLILPKDIYVCTFFFLIGSCIFGDNYVFNLNVVNIYVVHQEQLYTFLATSRFSSDE